MTITGGDVVPEGDLVEHEAGLGCVCGPSLQTLRSDLGLIQVVVHWSLDGRELEE